jgi:hypothetical protein
LVQELKAVSNSGSGGRTQLIKLQLYRLVWVVCGGTDGFSDEINRLCCILDENYFTINETLQLFLKVKENNIYYNR